MTNYSFTVTLLPRLYVDDCEKQFDDTNFHLTLQLHSISNYFTLIAELTKSGYNVHYHGIIELPSPRKFHNLFRKSKMFGFVKIREIFDMTKWVEYMHKDLANTNKELNRRPILHDDYKVFTLEDKMSYGIVFD